MAMGHRTDSRCGVFCNGDQFSVSKFGCRNKFQFHSFCQWRFHASVAIGVVLLIGNGNYKARAWKNPIHNADDVAEALSKHGFGVTKIIDANRRKMKIAINQFGRELSR